MHGAPTLLLVRHGEVSNPNHVVYGDLPGFHLSPHGVMQVHATGRHLAMSQVDVIFTSPLQRALETATAIARHHRLDPVIDERLTESGQFPHWTGNRWEELSGLFPGELDGYLHDASAATGQESLAEVAERYASVIASTIERPSSTIVLVGHQDPVQAARLRLTGRDLSDLRCDPPVHGEVITLVRGRDGMWIETERWSPSGSNG